MLDKNYISFINEIKQKIKQAQIKAAIKVNEELLRLYWDIAKEIVKRQQEAKWGDGIIEKISNDLKKEFPSLKGFSVRNLKYMKQWYLFYEKGQQAVAQIFQIPWGHNIAIITKCKNIDEALFYVNFRGTK